MPEFVCPAGAAVLRVRAAPGALRTAGTVFWKTMKTKLHQTGDQEKCLGYYNTGGSRHSESVTLMLQY